VDDQLSQADIPLFLTTVKENAPELHSKEVDTDLKTPGVAVWLVGNNMRGDWEFGIKTGAPLMIQGRGPGHGYTAQNVKSPMANSGVSRTYDLYFLLIFYLALTGACGLHI